MEGLAHANQRGMSFPFHCFLHFFLGSVFFELKLKLTPAVYTHPLILILWTILSLLLDYTLNWFPDPSFPLSYISPLMGFALIALPILAGTEYLHRPIFTRFLRETMGAPDMIAMERYYSLDPKSRVMVFEHKGEISGVVAVDGVRAGQSLGSVLGAEEGQLGEKEGVLEGVGFKKQGSKVERTLEGKQTDGLRKRNVKSGENGTTKKSNPQLVQIRHLTVDIPVRRAGVGTELLVSALDHAFGIATLPGSKGVSNPAEKVIVLTNPLSPGGEKVLRKCGFTSVAESETEDWPRAEKVGLLGWTGRWMGVSRSEWEAKREVIFAKPIK